jgi:hypothetical protein
MQNSAIKSHLRDDFELSYRDNLFRSESSSLPVLLMLSNKASFCFCKVSSSLRISSILFVIRPSGEELLSQAARQKQKIIISILMIGEFPAV